jgi:hypothetical protein
MTVDRSLEQHFAISKRIACDRRITRSRNGRIQALTRKRHQVPAHRLPRSAFRDRLEHVRGLRLYLGAMGRRAEPRRGRAGTGAAHRGPYRFAAPIERMVSIGRTASSGKSPIG